MQFQLRFSPALANKPNSSSSSAGKDKHQNPKPPPDPFDNPLPSLLVARLPLSTWRPQTDNKKHEEQEQEKQGHILVLNKFAVVPEHSILATAAWAPQTHLLRPADLEAT